MATFNGDDNPNLLPPVDGNNSGNDTFNPGKGKDTIDGGAGTDSLNINNSADPDTDPTTINFTTLTNGTITGGSNNGTTFQNIENVSFTTGFGNDNINVSAATSAGINGGNGNDTIVGGLTASNQFLHGDDGNDVVTAGNSISGDYIFGDAGNDTLNGGTGRDRAISF
jgi:Ca2+-binding RTX toxin-like protein